MAINVTNHIIHAILFKGTAHAKEENILTWLAENVGPRTEEPDFKPEVKEPNEQIIVHGEHSYRYHGKGWVIDFRSVLVPNTQNPNTFLPNSGNIISQIGSPLPHSPFKQETQYRLHFADDRDYVHFRLRWS